MLSEWYDRPVTTRFLWTSAIIWYVAHIVMWVAAAVATHADAAAVLNQSDSIYYSVIIESGYAGRNFAFFPLFPTVIHGLWVAVGRSVPPQFIGAGVSTACVAAFVWQTTKWMRRPELAGLVPGTRLAWMAFLLWPASYVLRTHHTEGLFLLLSALAFVHARQGRWVEGAVLAGMAALCRNQGVLVAVAVAYEVASQSPRSWVRFVVAGALSFAVFLPMPIYDFFATGDALAFYHAQREWTEVHGAKEIVRALWLGNPWQRHALGGVVHNVVWVGCLLAAWRMRAAWPIQGVYTLASIGIIIFQGELVMTFRFVAVLFPFLYFLGDSFARRGNLARLSFVALLLLLAIQTTWKYATGGHAY